MSEVRQRRDSAPRAPHPVLRAYYQQTEERPRFVRALFDRTACDYDRIDRIMSLGTGSRYRRAALARAGLEHGMRVLDVAVGTGLVAREAVAIVGEAAGVVGLDPSEGMMRSARAQAPIELVQGAAERLPFAAAQFDFVSMGFALRHVADLLATFREFRRVLRPSGIACVLEITAPERAWSRRLFALYLGRVVPLACRILAREADTARLYRYFWDTIETCVPPARVEDALAAAGLRAVRRRVQSGVFSEYTARR